MARTTMIAHKGKQICFLDFHDVTDNAQALLAIAEARKIVRSRPMASVLTLTWVAGSSFNKEVAAQLKELANGNRPYVRAGAVVGLSGLQHALFVAVAQFSGRRLATFRDIEQAKDWLAAHP